MIAAIVLAAGSSTRLGTPKQLAVLAGETLLERAVRVAQEAECSPVVVILGASHEEVLAGSSLDEVATVWNEEWAEGMGSSIRRGIAALRQCAGEVQGAVVMTCDQPAVTAAHLRRLSMGAEVRASHYAGRKGVPAYFPARCFGALMELRGDAGARELLIDAACEDLPGGELDVDTKEDLAQARRLISSEAR